MSALGSITIICLKNSAQHQHKSHELTAARSRQHYNKRRPISVTLGYRKRLPNLPFPFLLQSVFWCCRFYRLLFLPLSFLPVTNFTVSVFTACLIYRFRFFRGRFYRAWSLPFYRESCITSKSNLISRQLVHYRYLLMMRSGISSGI